MILRRSDFPAGQFCLHISSTEVCVFHYPHQQISSLEDRMKMIVFKERHLCCELNVTGLDLTKRKKEKKLSLSPVSQKRLPNPVLSDWHSGTQGGMLFDREYPG